MTTINQKILQQYFFSTMLFYSLLRRFAWHELNKEHVKKTIESCEKKLHATHVSAIFCFFCVFCFTVTPQSTMKPHNLQRHWSSVSPNCQWTLKIAPKAPLFAAEEGTGADWVVFDVTCVEGGNPTSKKKDEFLTNVLLDANIFLICHIIIWIHVK